MEKNLTEKTKDLRKVAIVLGTRPEIIKMSPIIRELNEGEFYIVHTGQHYDYQMDRIFFEQLKLPEPKYKLNIGSGTQAEQLGKMVMAIENVLTTEKPDIVLVQGDTNSVLSGALAACKLNIKVGHVEAGLRSYDRTMPEETNRVLTDHISDYLFTPTDDSRDILRHEGIAENKIFKVGNTIVGAVEQNIELARKFLRNGHKNPYCVVTLHRAENVDNITRFTEIIQGINLVAQKLNLVCIYPIHPRAEKMLEMFGVKIGEIVLTPPKDYLSFLELLSGAKLILTDSGGVQEEACIMKVPCVTLRDNTERPETIRIKANRLAGALSKVIVAKSAEALHSKCDWVNPYGDGKSGARIVKILRNGDKC